MCKLKWSRWTSAGPRHWPVFSMSSSSNKTRETNSQHCSKSSSTRSSSMSHKAMMQKNQLCLQSPPPNSTIKPWFNLHHNHLISIRFKKLVNYITKTYNNSYNISTSSYNQFWAKASTLKPHRRPATTFPIFKICSSSSKPRRSRRTTNLTKYSTRAARSSRTFYRSNSSRLNSKAVWLPHLTRTVIIAICCLAPSRKQIRLLNNRTLQNIICNSNHRLPRGPNWLDNLGQLHAHLQITTRVTTRATSNKIRVSV